MLKNAAGNDAAKKAAAEADANHQKNAWALIRCPVAESVYDLYRQKIYLGGKHQ